ncbi:MAG: hypothetical protein ABI980_12625, partial [Nitrospirota bacterium]
MSIERTGLQEREPVSSVAIPWCDVIDRSHSGVGGRAVPGGRFRNAPGVSGFQHAGKFLWTFLIGVLVLVAPGVGFTQEERTSSNAVTSPAPPQATPIGPPSPEEPKQSLSWEMRPGRSYLIPAFEILAYGFLLNLFDRHYTEPQDEYRTTGNTIRTHLTDSRWVL